PPPPDFSPGPSPVTPPAHVARTQETAHSEDVSARRQVVQHLQAILGRLRAMSQRLWAIILGRRRTIVVGGILLALVGAGAFVILRLPAPAPVVTEQPNTAPPPNPPPRPLQSEAEGYYEPTYQFTVSDRRFTGRWVVQGAPSHTRPVDSRPGGQIKKSPARTACRRQHHAGPRWGRRRVHGRRLGADDYARSRAWRPQPAVDAFPALPRHGRC